MTLCALARHAVTAWLNWRSRRAMQRVIPELRELEKRHAECRRGHKRGGAVIIKAKKAAVYRRLELETGRRL